MHDVTTLVQHQLWSIFSISGQSNASEEIIDMGQSNARPLGIIHALDHICMTNTTCHAYFLHFQDIYHFCMIFPLYVYPLSLCVKHDMQTCIPYKKIRTRLDHLFDQIGKYPSNMGYGRVWLSSLSTLVFSLLKGKLKS